MSRSALGLDAAHTESSSTTDGELAGWHAHLMLTAATGSQVSTSAAVAYTLVLMEGPVVEVAGSS
ncbi:hypothetical protein DKG71_35220 [Streptomyces sp. NEAU-S7GS2]|nr:hypothetical protein DKG71_35220 [Streptomyces sp. NEAU-S7GS2]